MLMDPMRVERRISRFRVADACAKIKLPGCGYPEYGLAVDLLCGERWLQNAPHYHGFWDRLKHAIRTARAEFHACRHQRWHLTIPKF